MPREALPYDDLVLRKKKPEAIDRIRAEVETYTDNVEELNLKVESLRTFVKQLTGTYEEEHEETA